MAFIKTSNLKREYWTDSVQFIALDDFSIEINQGEFIVILGPSGSGKTTLLNLLGGIDRPNQGNILFKNRNIAEISEKQLTIFRKNYIGFIFQFFNLIPTLTALENVELAGRLKYTPNEAKTRGKDLLKKVGLSEIEIHKYPSQLSGGQQQRVAIARALVKSPELVLADEPTGNLDTKTGDMIINLMKEICHSQNTTFLIVTHNVNISKSADRIIYIKDGKFFGESASEE